MSAIFLLPVCLTYWPRKYTTRVDPHVDNSQFTKFEVDITIHCRVIAFLSADRPTSRDVVTLTFNMYGKHMAGHVTNPATKFEDPTTVMSYEL